MNKYKTEFEILKNYLINDLNFNIEYITYFGSFAFNEQNFNPTTSDIDILVYCPEFNRGNADKYINRILECGGKFNDKPPIFLEDFISARIEFAYIVNNIRFDINIFPTFIKGIDEMHINVVHDSIDLVIGAMYLNSKVIYGNHPLEKIVNDKFLPFYNDDLRKARLTKLIERIEKMLSIIQKQSYNNDTLFYVYKCRNYIIKLIYIFLRKYPVDEGKHLNIVLKDLGFDQNSIDILTLKNNSIESFRNFCNNLIKNIKEDT